MPQDFGPQAKLFSLSGLPAGKFYCTFEYSLTICTPAREELGTPLPANPQCSTYPAHSCHILPNN